MTRDQSDISRRPIDVQDLTLAQVEAVELRVGLPIGKWSEVTSQAGLFRAILEESGRCTAEESGELPMRDLMASVRLADTPNP